MPRFRRRLKTEIKSLCKNVLNFSAAIKRSIDGIEKANHGKPRTGSPDHFIGRCFEEWTFKGSFHGRQSEWPSFLGLSRLELPRIIGLTDFGGDKFEKTHH